MPKCHFCKYDNPDDQQKCSRCGAALFGKCELQSRQPDSSRIITQVNGEGDQIGGYIAYYELEEWWLSTFSKQERDYIDATFVPLGGSSNSLTRGEIHKTSVNVDVFLNSLVTWFSDVNNSSI